SQQFLHAFNPRLAPLPSVNLRSRAGSRVLHFMRFSAHDNLRGGEGDSVNMAVRKIFSVFFLASKMFYWRWRFPHRALAAATARSWRYSDVSVIHQSLTRLLLSS
ncbi:MAG: hypothetical protein WB716_04550, partial [Candidatus Acidiferrales bacterium]